MRRDPTRVLFVTRAHVYGGAEKHTVELISHLEARGAEVHLLCLLRNVFDEAVSRYGVSAKIETRTPPSDLPGYVRCLRTVRPDVVVFINSEFKLFSWQAHLAARLAGARRVLDIEHLIADALARGTIQRGPLGWIRRAIGWRSRMRWLGRLSTTFLSGTICCSDAVRDRLLEDYGYRPRRTITVRNGIDPELYRRMPSRAAARETLGITMEADIVVMTAALVRQKRVDVLIRAMELVLPVRPSCLCLILGDGPLADELQAMVEARVLTSTVRLVGRVANVGLYLAASDLFVLSSDKEGLPYALLEAMACGLPSVVTRAGGNAEAIRDGKEGRLVDCGDVTGLAEAVLEVLTLKDAREVMGVRARERVERHFDVRKMMDALSPVILG